MEKSTCFLRIIIKNSNISNEDINVKYHINIFVHRYSTSYYSNYFKLFNFFFQRALENARSHRVYSCDLRDPWNCCVEPLDSTKHTLGVATIDNRSRGRTTNIHYRRSSNFARFFVPGTSPSGTTITNTLYGHNSLWPITVPHFTRVLFNI